ncbi:MAG: hypothetical protein D6677_08250 [Calditrichaeota bacterium]|nr:MAG: hypothetical protein D6677_08250 [Calditrichota bacterium]
MALFEPNIARLKEKKNIKGLIKALHHNSINIQVEAARALGALYARDALDDLITATTDWNDRVQIAAIEAIGKIGHAKGIKPLLFALKDRNERVKEAAIRALTEIGDDAIEPLIDFLRNGDESLRQSATDALVELGKPAFKAITRIISDHNAENRPLLAGVLQGNGSREAIDLLLELLNDPEFDMRQAAINALYRLGAKAIPQILETAQSPDCDLMSLLNLMAQIGDKRCMAFYFENLDDGDWRIRQLAAKGLDKIGWRPGQDVRGVWYRIARQEWNYVVAMGSVAIEPLSIVLEDKNERIRKAALAAMGKIGTSGRDALIESLNDPHAENRLHAVSALGKMDDPSVIRALAQCLRDEDTRVRRAVVTALGRFRNAACINPLILALKDSDPIVRRDAIAYLKPFDDPRKKDLFLAMLEDRSQTVIEMLSEAMLPEKELYFDELVERLDEKNPVIKRNAIRILGHYGDSRAVPAIIPVLTSQNNALRQASCTALGEIGDRRAINSLMPVLKDHVEDVAMAAAYALARIGKPALPVLLKQMIGRKKNIYAELALKEMGTEAIGTLIGLLHHSDPQIKKTAAKVLDILEWQPGDDDAGAAYWIAKQNWDKGVELGDKAVQPLLDVLNDSELWNRMEAAKRLGKIGDKKAVDSLIGLLTDKYWNVRAAAADALVSLGRKAVEPLINAMLTGNKEAFGIISDILGKIGDARAIQPLEYLLRDNRPFVREAAAHALKKLNALNNNIRCAHCGNKLPAKIKNNDICPFCNRSVQIPDEKDIIIVEDDH